MILHGFLVLFLAGTGVFGLVVGLGGVETAESSGPMLASIADLGFGAAGVAGAILLAMRRPAAPWVVAVWALCATFASALGPVVRDDAAILTGVLSGAITGVLTTAVLWASLDYVNDGA